MSDYLRSCMRLAVIATLITGCSSSSSGPKVVSTPQPVLTQEQAAVEATDGDLGFSEWNTRPSDQVAPGFEIKIKNSEDAKVNGVYKIDAKGILELPYDVKVDTNGLTVPQLRDRVRAAYKQFLKSPRLEIVVTKKEYFVDVRGLVNKPGTYLVDPVSSLDEVIAAAGGLRDSTNPNAVPRYARINQLGVTNVLSLRDYFGGDDEVRAKVPQWQGGELIFLQSEAPVGALAGKAGGYVQFVGEVRHPGEYQYEREADFFDYLVRAGGPTDRANMDKVQVVRVNGGRRETLEFRVDDLSSHPAIRPGDSILVRAENPSNFEKHTRVVGGIASIFSTFATLVLIFLAT